MTLKNKKYHDSKTKTSGSKFATKQQQADNSHKLQAFLLTTETNVAPSVLPHTSALPAFFIRDREPLKRI